MTDDKEQSGLGGPPKNFLVPFMLLLMSNVPIHGYELIQRLTSLGFQALDQGNIYRMLRQLEKNNFVRSTWDTSSTGPAKRVYSLTEIGEAYLKTYAAELERYQTMLTHFFSMYTNMFNLYMPPYRAEGDMQKIDNQKKKEMKPDDPESK
ncbi:poly-beta-hydroxybutyrate-responsive repressor [Effusibacillus lacus]|uniref:PadR family transcriptional regulator n=1 Tax=Effusibacillus lacus TaxID=1348429 RepID=A0A292YQJ4_9BACL|nr:poly-beta-hydroxybutyrate-responsive repressor [Effusibacillus lacus]TCS71117.1 poly-beta-hydroxybutyrate-responsive repressor [Effusibacillus lacus]GAX90760.1 PadR family transcriptional regulator [Effusibacillus lacus]